MNTLRAIVSLRDDGTYLAEMLDLEVFVFASSENEVASAFERALIMEYSVARRLGQSPFESVIRKNPARPDVRWVASRANSAALHLPDEVYDALAKALHSPGRPIFESQLLPAA